VLCSLAGTRVGVVLLPGEASFFPTLVHGVNKVLTETPEQILRFASVGTFLRGNVLYAHVSLCTTSPRKHMGETLPVVETKLGS
jgi:hypothetical protein